MKRLKRILASLLAVSACISMAVCPVGAADVAPYEASQIGSTSATVDETTIWQYLDNNTDPGTQEDRTSWTKQVDEGAQGWKNAAGRFGAKNGQIANLGAGYTDVDFTPSVLLNQYINGTSGDDIPAFFFRTTFQVEDASAVTKLVGELYYDDAAIVYVNGEKVAAFDEPSGGFSSNLSYGGSNASAPKQGKIDVSDPKMLVDGTNVLAVELHQGRSSSSDIYLAVNSFTASTEPESNELEVSSLTVNIGATEDVLGITWYDKSAEVAVLHFGGTDYTATVQQASKTGYYVNHVDLTGLKASTTYTYTISAEGKTSKEYSYTTPSFGSESFTFAAVGDPQIGAGNATADTQRWSSAVDSILSDGNDYNFLFSLGDQINTYYNGGSNLSSVESEYDGFFQNEKLSSIALATLVGNHDNGNDSSLYIQHFQMPGVTAYGQVKAGDGDYSFTYGGVQFMVLNTSNLSISEHQTFLKETLKNNPDANWNVVCFHKSMYSVASHVTEDDIVALRNGLSPIFKELGIDVVLQGHDHVYARSYIMGGENGMTADVQKNEDGSALTDIYNPQGVQYVTLNSGSGSKFYKITNEAFTYTAVKNQENTPNYSKVSVTPETFTVTTYRTSDKSVVDTFTLHKEAKPSGELQVEDLVVNIGAKEDTVTVSWYDKNSETETLAFGDKDYSATATAVDKKGYYVHRVQVEGLTEKTDYTYSIACGEQKSQEYTYHTGSFGTSFSFAAVGDPQLYAKKLATDIDGWSNTVERLQKDGTDYSFLMSLGDQINEYYNKDGSNLDTVESEYTGFFSAPGLSSMALATAVGNHDNGYNSKLYTDHFSLPNTSDRGAVGTGDGDYYFTYGGVLFMTLNTNNLSIADHKAFMEETIQNNPGANWIIVSFHQSLYSVAKHVTDDNIVALRNGLSPVLKELNVNLVLQGHDHVYDRSYIMGGENGMTADVQQNQDGSALADIYNPQGVQYVTLNSGSGSKTYDITKEAFTYTTVKNQEKIANYSKVSVTPETLTVTTYRATDGTVVDSFTLHKGDKPGTDPEPDPKPDQKPCDGGDKCPSKGFTDVNQKEYYHEAVDSVVESKLMIGMGNNSFGVGKPMTRGMVATVLYRMAGSPAVQGTTAFTDLEKDAYYEDAVIWAAQNGITEGMSKDSFGPQLTVTREQMVTFLYRYAKYKGMDLTINGDLKAFTDNGDVADYAVDAMTWAVGKTLVKGMGNNTLAPKEPLLREQCAELVYRMGKLA